MKAVVAVIFIMFFMFMPRASIALELNSAGLDELATIKGIGPNLLEKISRARQRQLFTDWQNFVQRIKGLGYAKAQLFSDQGLTINGQSFVMPFQVPATQPGSRAKSVGRSSSVPQQQLSMQRPVLRADARLAPARYKPKKPAFRQQDADRPSYRLQYLH